MNKEQITRAIKESDMNSYELNLLIDEIKIIETRKISQESIKNKKNEIEVLEKRIRDIDTGDYSEEIPQENDYYQNR